MRTELLFPLMLSPYGMVLLDMFLLYVIFLCYCNSGKMIVIMMIVTRTREEDKYRNQRNKKGGRERRKNNKNVEKL